MLFKRSHIALFLLTLFVCSVTPVFGEEPDDVSRSLGISADETYTTSRFPRPASKIAEDVTVVDADDIARINAHTLADVLQTVPGIELDDVQTPGTFTFFSILGTTTRHVQLLIDGVPQNFLSGDNIVDPGTIPAQMIERVEIIKGAASAAWGSALGGVVNVITKSPTADRPVGGMASGSTGEARTTDVRGELSGTVDRFGYYLTGGKIHSKGLLPGNRTNFNHAFGKFTYELPARGDLTMGLEVRDASIGTGEIPSFPPFGFRGAGDMHYLNGYLAFRYPLAERLTLLMQGMGGRRQQSSQWEAITAPIIFNDAADRELYRGVKLGLSWGDADKNLAGGVEYEHDDLMQRELARKSPFSQFDLALDRCAAYLNGTYTIGRLSILPGMRYDRTSLLEDALSYTLGVTYRLTDSTILRAYAARGYSLPAINDIAVSNGHRELQNIYTAQAGVESSAIPYLWVKGTIFYNNIWKIQTFAGSPAAPQINLAEQIRQGGDLELRTSPLYGAALTAGYTYNQAFDKATKAELVAGNGPRQVVKAGLNYDNAALGLRGALLGNYARWHALGENAKQTAMVWDLHLTQKLLPNKELSPELFFSAHNIFDGAQFEQDVYPNASRWFEGGVRVEF